MKGVINKKGKMMIAAHRNFSYWVSKIAIANKCKA